MRVSRLHRVPRPLDKRSSLAQRLLALRPLQTRADAFVLVILGYRHHVRVAVNLVVWPHRREVMHKTDHSIRNKRSERPAARLARHDQMTPRRDLQIGKPEGFALQGHTTVKLFDGCALTNLNLFHALTFLSLRLSCA